MDWENKRRDYQQGVSIDSGPKSTQAEDDLDLTAERLTLTDWENHKFRYYL